MRCAFRKIICYIKNKGKNKDTVGLSLSNKVIWTGGHATMQLKLKGIEMDFIACVAEMLFLN